MDRLIGGRGVVAGVDGRVCKFKLAADTGGLVREVEEGVEGIGVVEVAIKV